MSLFPGTPGSRNCSETVPVGVPGLWELITPDYEVWSQRGLNQTCNPHRNLFNDVSHSQFGGREEVDFRLLMAGSQTWLPALLLPITWATDVQMTNARPFSISTLQDLFNETKNTSMRGVLGLAIELWTFGSPGGLQILTFSKCWASPSHLAKVGLRHNSCLCQVYIFLQLRIVVSSKPWFGEIVCQNHIAMVDSINMIFTTLCKVQ
jgi:hypothetical protein